ncbi:hypothetical protein VPH35_007793 [Triticum aestivum]
MGCMRGSDGPEASCRWSPLPTPARARRPSSTDGSTGLVRPTHRRGAPHPFLPASPMISVAPMGVGSLQQPPGSTPHLAAMSRRRDLPGTPRHLTQKPMNCRPPPMKPPREH